MDVTSLYNRRADHRWDRVCVGDILERVTWSRPDQVAITGWPGAFGEPGYERLTYRQADEIANRFARGLLARGLVRGDRVLLICENSVEAYLAKIATAKAGRWRCRSIPPWRRTCWRTRSSSSSPGS
jgi:acyl-CoA synthetase (AMP-forming)/AMP-acid ligase II